MNSRDIIVVGASMGGVEALSALVGQLPSDLPAALFVVQHTAPDSPGLLAEVLGRRTTLAVEQAKDGVPIRRGTVYVAPPNRHLLLTPRGVAVVFGPRENRTRPAIDPLFRTGAVHYRSRVIGVVLTGLQGDGSSGLRAIERCGGLCIVQAPEDAPYPEMPQRALAAVPTAATVTLSALGDLLGRACREPAPPPPEIPYGLALEVRLTERGMDTNEWNTFPGEPTDLTCPECKGPLRQLADDGMRRYRCRVGHAFSLSDLVGENGKVVEDSLWLALETLEERAQLLGTMARDDERRGWTKTASAFDERAREARTHADRLRALLIEIPE